MCVIHHYKNKVIAVYDKRFVQHPMLITPCLEDSGRGDDAGEKEKKNDILCQRWGRRSKKKWHSTQPVENDKWLEYIAPSTASYHWLSALVAYLIVISAWT